MSDSFGKDELLDLLLRGTPDRLIDAAVSLTPEGPRAAAALRDALAIAALSAEPAKPSDSLKARILAKKPKPKRPERPVVVVLDMIQDHLTPGRPLEVPRAREIVPSLRARLDAWRREKIPIIFVCDTHPEGDHDFAEWPTHAIEGTPGADPWPELGQQGEDLVVRKKTYSAFNGSSLQAELDRLGADQIILTGCLTEIGMQVTASDALQRGYVVTMPPDCQAGMHELTERATMLSLSTMPPYDPIYLRKGH